MATYTTVVTRRPQKERRHDFVYEPTHVLCSEKDHARAAFKAHTSEDRVLKVPIYRAMFSEMRHYPSYTLRLLPHDPVPDFMEKNWRGKSEQDRQNLIQYKRFNYDPNVTIEPRVIPDPEVSGKNRCLYFRRPIMPYIQAIPPSVVLAAGIHDPLDGKIGKRRQVSSGVVTRAIATQTDYRESYAQTLPYSPEYVVRPGEQPELLTLATLCFNHGLPAGLAEVEMIERARQKRLWEQTLPPLNNMALLAKRRKMMDDMEREEWAVREREIEKLQEERLELLKKLLQEREQNHQELNNNRLDNLWSKKQKVKDSKLRQLRKEHIKAIRKLLLRRKNVENKLERRKIVNSYADYGSEAFAPLTRNGVFPDRNSERYVVKSRYLSSYSGLCELESSLPAFVTLPRIQVHPPKQVTKDGFVKRAFRHERELAKMHEQLKAKKDQKVEPPKPLRFLVRVEKPVPRPPTPSLDEPSLEDVEKELAVTFLQKIIRGRAIQNMMFEGKEKRRELIAELRSTHALQEAEQKQKEEEMQTAFAIQRQRHLHEHREFTIDQAMNVIEGETVADMFDFLCKELIRLQEERKIHAYLMLAERQRRIREAEESGRRQVEERRRREADEIFKQVVKVHQDTIETYLTDIIASSNDATAHEVARAEIEEKARKINEIAYATEETRDALQSEEIVADLVHCFLIPEIKKQTMREQIHLKQRKYLLAAHRTVVSEAEPVIQMNAAPLVAYKGRDPDKFAKVYTSSKSPQNQNKIFGIEELDSSLSLGHLTRDEEILSCSDEEQRERGNKGTKYTRRVSTRDSNDLDNVTQATMEGSLVRGDDEDAWSLDYNVTNINDIEDRQSIPSFMSVYEDQEEGDQAQCKGSVDSDPRLSSDGDIGMVHGSFPEGVKLSTSVTIKSSKRGKESEVALEDTNADISAAARSEAKSDTESVLDAGTALEDVPRAGSPESFDPSRFLMEDDEVDRANDVTILHVKRAGSPASFETITTKIEKLDQAPEFEAVAEEAPQVTYTQEHGPEPPTDDSTD